ncbi:hypothetical protein ACH5RR_017125 [Cinchona calisaya]|uniref:RING-type E3 ubiquitin transferase n=1 Tax=Cinchona calisaya TaxID=153742 RepID=A0ABD3A006_9GENT
MGGEGEIITEGVCDVENTIFVAVGVNMEEGKSILSWTLKSFPGKSICLLHVHQPTQLLSLVNERLAASKLKLQAAKTCQELERQKMHDILNEYLLLIEQVGIQPGKIWIEMRNVEEGIVHVVSEHGVKWLVMGAAAEKSYSKNLSVLKSSKAIFVYHQAPVSCQIWFSCKGFLIRTRFNAIGPHLTGNVTLSSQINKSIFQYSEEDADKDMKSVQFLEFEEKGVNGWNLPHSMMGEMKGDGSPLFSPNRSQYSPRSSSVHLLEDEFEVEETMDDQLESAVTEAENSKQRPIEEPVRGCRAEEHAFKNMHGAEASEGLYSEEINQRQDVESLLKKQRQELETMKNEHNKIGKELQLVQNQKLTLERQIMKNSGTEKELEEKIIQAVNLLISFKGKRDALRIERDNALREAREFRKLIKEDAAAFCISQFFAFSFLIIMEATQNFDPSMKIGEGKFGSVYKGILHHVKAAIKMLPPCGSQSDADFEHEAEVLSRVRHPNLVTLLGACTESRSLIYEYLENGSLEDHLVGRSKSPLPWQFRLKIASEICSALIFLHANKSCVVHGNLSLRNILLDANLVSKISDLGTSNFQGGQNSCMKNQTEASIYQDPECLNGSYTTESDVYSFGIVLLQLLTARLASTIVRDVQCAMEVGNIGTVLDYSAGDWPLEQVKQLASLALRCCEEKRLNRPDLVAEIWPVIEPMRNVCTWSCLDSSSSCLESKGQRRIPSYFVCPIYQEVMKDPYIAADGFTYEADAIRGWLNSGHETSPMTNLKLDHCDLLPNSALYYAIQEWQQQS